jgi:hypothetical protein
LTATFRRLLAPWCAALLLASCGNFLESDQSNDNQTQTAPPDGLAEEELNTEAEDVIVAVGTTDNTTHTSHTQVLKLSDPATGTFVVHDNATSFLLSAFSDSRAQIVSLTSPSGREELAYLDSKAAGITSFGNGSYDNYLVPMRPDILPEAGTWRYEISGANDVRLTLREDLRESDNATLLLQPYLTTSAPSDLSTVLARIAEIYTQNELSVTIAEPLSLSTQYAVVSSSFSDTTTQTLLQQGRADAVNIFLVDDFQFGGVLGIAAGIPGSLGIESEWNGVSVIQSAFRYRAAGGDGGARGRTSAWFVAPDRRGRDGV